MNPMNRILFPVLILGLSLAPVLGWAAGPSANQAPASTAQPQPKASDHDAAQLKSLQDERIKALTQLVEIVLAHYKVGAADITQVISAEKELCDALWDSTADAEKRVALLTKQLDTANDLLKVTQHMFDFGTVSEADVLRAKSLLLGLKIKLLRERSRKRAGELAAEPCSHEATTVEKKAFIELLNKLPRRGKFFTDEAVKKAAPNPCPAGPGPERRRPAQPLSVPRPK